jgi:hypothetical protein
MTNFGAVEGVMEHPQNIETPVTGFQRDPGNPFGIIKTILYTAACRKRAA